MQGDVLQTLVAWAINLLLYPGLLLGLMLAAVGEYAWGALRPLLVPRLQRLQARPHDLLQPLYTLRKLARRQSAFSWQPSEQGAQDRSSSDMLALASVIGPLLTLALIPLPGSPLARIASVGNLLLVFVLLAVQPLISAYLRLRDGSAQSLPGEQALGRLLTGLMPTLAAVAALSEAAGVRSLQIASLSAAPETAAQFLVRLLAGAALLVSLPWWVGESSHESATSYVGRLLQRAALALLWSVLVLPAAGELGWAIFVSLGGALLAYVTFRAISERWVPARRAKDAASLLWATGLPVAGVALLVAIWSGV